MAEIVAPGREWPCGCSDSPFVREGLYYDGGSYYCVHWFRDGSEQCARRQDEVTRG